MMKIKQMVCIGLSCLAVTASYADSSDSRVQLYGNIDAGIEHLTFDQKSINRLGSGLQLPDFIGIKGAEDLGGGLSALFQAETGFCGNGNSGNAYSGQDQGAQFSSSANFCTGGGFMGRQTMVGLSGNFGEFTFGRLLTPLFLNAASADPFMVGTTGGIFNLDPATPVYAFMSQAAQYQTPGIHGFQGTVMYAFGGQANSVSNGQFYNASLNYNNGPLAAGIAYMHHDFSASTPIPDAALLLDATNRSIIPSSNGYFSNKVIQVFGGYDFGIAKLTAYYADEKFGSGGSMSDGSATPNLKVWWIGAAIPAGGGSILASFGQHKDANLASSTARQYAIGYNYPMSRQTNIYASYAHISNGANVDQYVGDSTVVGTGLQGGQSSNGVALGFRHMF
jgi:predicted porin